MFTITYFLHIYLVTIFTSSPFNFTKNANLQKSLSFENSIKQETFWKVSSNKGDIRQDSKSFMNGNASWSLKGYSKDFSIYIYNYFNLPIKGENIELSICSKTTGTIFTKLKIWCLDLQENIIKRDSITLQNTGEWVKDSLFLKVPKTERLYIEIDTKAVNPESFDPRNTNITNIDNLKLKIDGRNIHEIELSDKYLTSNSTIPLKSDSCFQLSSLFQDSTPRIIAFGETIHGVDEFQKLAYSTAKDLILKNNCKLVLLEISFEEGLIVNEFINGTLPENELKRRFLNYNLGYEYLFNLLIFIKEYNLTCKQKVFVMGFDSNHVLVGGIKLNMRGLQGFNHLLDYIKFQNIKHDSIQSFYKTFKTNDYQRIKDFAIINHIFDELDNFKKKCIFRVLDLNMDKIPNSNSLLEGEREYIQFLNTRFILENAPTDNSKTFIYAHLGHVAKFNSETIRMSVPNFGNYMNNYYKNDYFTVALIAGNGTLTNHDSIGNLSKLPLLSSPPGGIENILESSGKERCFIPSNAIESAYYIRLLGLKYYKDQFYPFHPLKRVNALYFFKNVNGAIFPKDSPTTKKEIWENINKQREMNGLKPL